MRLQFGAPYIGITDFLSFVQVSKMLEVFNRYRNPQSNRRLHVGVMMSRKTLTGERSRFTSIFPPKERIGEIFGSDETINCLHYADYHYDPDLFSNLTRAIRFGGVNIHALQLDMTWPDPATIANAVSASGKNIEVILQVGKDAMKEADDDITEIINRISDYGDIINRVLLDVSMGSGVLINPDKTLQLMLAIHNRLPILKLVIAGGLGPGTVGIIAPIAKEFPNVSIDAQGRLRSSGSNLDPINWSIATEYLRESLEILM